jgi:hypothetical protein
MDQALDEMSDGHVLGRDDSKPSSGIRSGAWGVGDFPSAAQMTKAQIDIFDRSGILNLLIQAFPR